ncbi:MAG: DUF5694 domain-containing protein [Cytophagales bacterium]|nr:DUF5694 domain-containing protein [Cytophagales bacterium]
MKMNFIKLVVLLLLTGTMQVSFGQSDTPDIKTLSAPFESQPKSKVMILGTFHFNDGGNDSYKPKYSVNIKSPSRQKEVAALLEILKEFRPTKVTIENMPERQAFHDSLYTEFLKDNYQPGANEIYQICYRLAKMMGHEKVYTIDAPARSYEPEIDVDKVIPLLHQENYKDSTYSKLYFSLYAKEDSLKSVLPLRTTLLYQNNPTRLNLGLGHYLIGDFKVSVPGNYAGPDAAIYWWSRNLRIFANILKLAAESKEERVFVMIGAGHLPILRFLAVACPEIEFVGCV